MKKWWQRAGDEKGERRKPATTYLYMSCVYIFHMQKTKRGVIKMKKGLAILITVMIVAGATIGAVAAEDYLIDTELSINGTGSFDRVLEVQTELGYMGKSLDEDFYTRWMGTDGDSKLQYNSILEVYMGNSSEFKDTKITTIDYAQTKKSTNAQWVLCSSNYDMGGSAGVISKGNMIGSIQVGMDDMVNELEFEGSINGRLRLMQQAVDPATKEVYLMEDTKLEGRYDAVWYSFIEKISYPEGDGDWLGCP